MDPLNFAKQAGMAAAEKKATRIIVLDLHGKSDLCHAKMICSASNDVQTRAIADAIESHCFKVAGVKPVMVEGKQNGHWIVLDYGFVIVHIFFDYLRDYYALEQLWPGAKFINL